MKSYKRHSDTDTPLESPTLNRPAVNVVSGAAGIANGKIAEIKLQIASGGYHFDTDVLAYKLLAAGVLRAGSKE
tara:strand:- start:3262 stop:3483 length:222 start_codon:yes stop_codon:yes gene_type:complete